MKKLLIFDFINRLNRIFCIANVANKHRYGESELL